MAAVYYEENGSRSPISGKGATLARRIRARRNEGGMLARWEVIAASLAAGDTPRESYPVAIDPGALREGRRRPRDLVHRPRHRVAAPATRESETAEAEVS